MRINKFISNNSEYSRREADELIKNGSVTINGKKALVTDSVKDGDRVKINHKIVKENMKYTMIVYHKQKGELVTKSDDRGRKTIYDALPSKFKNFISVGRLDFASEGLLILTDSPMIATALMNSDLEREYYIKVKGVIDDSVIESMKNGIFLEDATKGAHHKSKITSMTIKPFLAYRIISISGGYTRLKVIINEGQNRELRRFFGSFDLEVMDLKRTAYGRVELGFLKPGKFRFFSKSEYEDLRDFLKK